MSNPLISRAYELIIGARREALRAKLAEILPTPTEFVCELGAGHGHFLTAYAHHHRELTCIGLDIIADRVDRANRKRDRAGLKNLHFLHAEARIFLESIPASATIAAVIILFPDPWPKTRHHKHRLIQSDFLTLLGQHVRPDARLYFRTDELAYFEQAETTVRTHPGWELIAEPLPFEHETVFQKRASAFYSFTARPRP